MTAPTSTIPQTRSAGRSGACPNDCDSCAWGISGANAKPGSTSIPLIDKTPMSYNSQCGVVQVVITGSGQMGAIHQGRYFAGRRVPAAKRIATHLGLIAA